MKGQITSFRRARHTQYGNQMIVAVEKTEDRESAAKLVGKKAVFTTESGKEISGEIRAAHGGKGCVRVLFENGMPGQSLGAEVKIQ